MKQIVIIGAGAAGILLLLCLEKAGIQPEQITVIDPYFDGGDLMRKWSHIRSNTVWRQILEACPSRKALIEPFRSLVPEQICELRHIASYLLFCVKPFLSNCNTKNTSATTATQTKTGQWSVQLKNSSTPIIADVLIVATGSEPKTMDLPFSCIPLDIALDPFTLGHYVTPDDNVLVFGTAHSGTLIVQNLLDKNVKTITNFYATPKPFYFARDGEYDGIKQEAATIADKILANTYPNVELVPITDIASVIRTTKRADKVIYATGFEKRESLGLSMEYDGATGRLKNYTNAWGFGIAFPNLADDGKHWDVSVPSFMAHIQKQLPDILSSLRIE